MMLEKEKRVNITNNIISPKDPKWYWKAAFVNSIPFIIFWLYCFEVIIINDVIPKIIKLIKYVCNNPIFAWRW